MTTNSEAEKRATGLRIGAVARLIGVSVHTLRKWEDRHGAVKPQRTPGGERLYSQDDLKRLGLIRRLSTAGLPIGQLAPLSAEELERTGEELGQGSVAQGPSTTSVPVRVAVLGQALPALMAGSQGFLTRMQLLAQAHDVDGLKRRLASEQPEILIVECPTVYTETLNDIRRFMAETGALGSIVVYGYGSRKDIDALRGEAIVTVRAPLDVAELQHVAVGLAHELDAARGASAEATGNASAEIPPRRLSHAMVVQVAASAPQVQCECPRHLADLVASLYAFEDYSAACESRNSVDAALHRYLWVTTARARASFETALIRVAESEGIPIDVVPNDNGA